MRVATRLMDGTAQSRDRRELRAGGSDPRGSPGEIPRLPSFHPHVQLGLGHHPGSQSSGLGMHSSAEGDAFAQHSVH